MSPTIIVALVSLAGTIIGTFGGIMAANKLTTYRIEQLEKKVDKHNNLIARMAVAERELKNHRYEIEEIKEELKAE